VADDAKEERIMLKHELPIYVRPHALNALAAYAPDRDLYIIYQMIEVQMDLLRIGPPENTSRWWAGVCDAQGREYYGYGDDEDEAIRNLLRKLAEEFICLN
jgi:hypothetical protein